jgi:hypothetical protein
MSTADTSGRDPSAPTIFTWLATAVAIAGVGGSLYLSINRGLRACPLCLYERAFLMGVVGVLVTGLLFKGVPKGFLSVLALPMAVAGLVIIILHVRLEANGTIECPSGFGGFGSVPQQALGVFVLLLVLLVIDDLKEHFAVRSFFAAALGGLLAYGAILSGPKLADAPPGGYTVDLHDDGCRKPYTPPIPTKV